MKAYCFSTLLDSGSLYNWTDITELGSLCVASKSPICSVFKVIVTDL